ncbi:hypothetical protein FA95DRAFT_1506625, partial [Auriscalpium vulgare]
MVITMPLRGARTVPIFDPDLPKEMGRFFADLAALLALANITGDRQKKDWTKRYVPIEVADLFDAIPEFSDARSTFEDFQKAVTKLYPGADEDQSYSTFDLATLISTAQSNSATTIEIFAAYHRTFLVISSFLIRKNRYSALQQKCDFPLGIPNALLDRVRTRLQIRKPDIMPEDSYEVSDVYSAVQFVLESSSAHSYRSKSQVTPTAMP